MDPLTQTGVIPAHREAPEPLAMNIRAGRFVQQAQGYQTIEPAAPPPDPPIHFDGGLLSVLSQADQALGRLDGTAGTPPNPDLFVAMHVR